MLAAGWSTASTADTGDAATSSLRCGLEDTTRIPCLSGNIPWWQGGFRRVSGILNRIDVMLNCILHARNMIFIIKSRFYIHSTIVLYL